jgi:hypothetical protein
MDEPHRPLDIRVCVPFDWSISLFGILHNPIIYLALRQFWLIATVELSCVMIPRIEDGITLLVSPAVQAFRFAVLTQA